MPTIQVTVTDDDNASGNAEATIEVGDTDVQITSLTANPSVLDPGGSTTVEVQGIGYTSVEWSSSSSLGDGDRFSELNREERQTFTVHPIVRADTVYTITATLIGSTGFGRSQSVIVTIRNVAPEAGTIVMLNDNPFPDVLRVDETGIAKIISTRDNNGDGLTYDWSGGRIGNALDVTNLPVNQFAYECPSTTGGENVNGIPIAIDHIKCIVSDVPPAGNQSLDDTERKNVIIDANPPGLPEFEEIDIRHITDNSISVEWNPPNNTGGASITGYHLSYRAGSSGAWSDDITFSPTLTTHTITDLSTGTTHGIRVRALNTFEVRGVNYGHIGNYAVTSATTTGIFIVDPPVPVENRAPVITPVSNVVQVFNIPSTAILDPIDIIATWEDPDGDEVTIVWKLVIIGSGTIEVIDPADYVLNTIYPSTGSTTCRFYPPNIPYEENFFTQFAFFLDVYDVQTPPLSSLQIFRINIDRQYEEDDN